MNAPQVILLVYLGTSLGVGLALHGKPQTGKHSFWTSLIAMSLLGGLLYWGGFFSGGAA